MQILQAFLFSTYPEVYSINSSYPFCEAFSPESLAFRTGLKVPGIKPY
ncbi:MAG TPA: hypothetical protein VFW07_24755 [Parafilimonas sp.]|nr:hypothetical protein [Parafilimonas sp.]